MKSRYEAYMDRVSLESISPRILIEDIKHTPAKKSFQSYTSANRNGAVVTDTYYDKALCTIVFSVNEYDIAKRQEIIQRIRKWAGGEILTVNDRPGQRLRCRAEELPTIQSAKQWTNQIEITFAAYETPFWEDVYARTVTLTGTNESQSIYVPGDADKTFIECEVTANSAITGLTISCGNEYFQLTDISVPAEGVVKFLYDERKILSIKYGNTSLLGKRTGLSSDDLTAECGKQNTFGVTASASVSALFKIRGCWM